MFQTNFDYTEDPGIPVIHHMPSICKALEPQDKMKAHILLDSVCVRHQNRKVISISGCWCYWREAWGLRDMLWNLMGMMKILVKWLSLLLSLVPRVQPPEPM